MQLTLEGSTSGIASSLIPVVALEGSWDTTGEVGEAMLLGIKCNYRLGVIKNGGIAKMGYHNQKASAVQVSVDVGINRIRRGVAAITGGQSIAVWMAMN